MSYKHLKQINYQEQIPKIRSIVDSHNIIIKSQRKINVKLPKIKKTKMAGTERWANLNMKAIDEYFYTTSHILANKHKAARFPSNPKLKKMYAKRGDNNWKIGFADNFDDVKECKNVALPQTIRDPRYMKIKETITKTLKRPKNYQPNINQEKFKDYEKKMKDMLTKLPNCSSCTNLVDNSMGYESRNKNKNANTRLRLSVQPTLNRDDTEMEVQLKVTNNRNSSLN